jgi:hypothetical protein
MTDYRALCAELADALAEQDRCWMLINDARAALAQPEPVVDDDFVTAVNDLAKRTHKSKAEVLRDAINLYYKAVNEWEKNGRGIVFQKITQPKPVGPTDEELYELWEQEGYEGDFQDCRRFARAVLARYGTPAIAAELETQ